MKLYAFSDLHLDHKPNREALTQLPSFPNDWLLTGGDLCTSERHLRETLDVLCHRFAKVFWVPGNHELWSSRPENGVKRLAGEEKYLSLVEVCREYGVLTPEDPFVNWPGVGGPAVIAPLFVLYDYSFAPDNISADKAVDWAMESGILCNDEKLIEPNPYSSLPEWCKARYNYSESRLAAIDPGTPVVLLNHFPLRRDLVRLRRIPRFIIWCGTRKTEDWHQRFNLKVAVSGHLHMRATDYRDSVRFEEVSVGYPRDWVRNLGMAHYLREILPGPTQIHQGNYGPIWKF